MAQSIRKLLRTREFLAYKYKNAVTRGLLCLQNALFVYIFLANNCNKTVISNYLLKYAKYKKNDLAVFDNPIVKCCFRCSIILVHLVLLDFKCYYYKSNVHLFLEPLFHLVWQHTAYVYEMLLKTMLYGNKYLLFP